MITIDMVVYSKARITGNATDRLLESGSLHEFARNYALKNWDENKPGSDDSGEALLTIIGPACMAATPFVYLWHFVAGPFLYRNKQEP